jgi:DNA-directed RNA polymerase I, II, and III subunit RPABC1
MNDEKYAIKVLSEMLIDRGYHIQHIDSENISEQTYVIKAFMKDQPKDVILCFISPTTEEKLNIQGIKDRICVMNKENASRCIIVYRTNVTSSAKKSLETLEYHFELFGLHELQINITKHRLVPRHQKVSMEEKEELDLKYKGKLPFILHGDAVSRYYAYQKGEYIRITRKNGTILYRVVK